MSKQAIFKRYHNYHLDDKITEDMQRLHANVENWLSSMSQRIPSHDYQKNTLKRSGFKLKILSLPTEGILCHFCF